MTLLSTKPYLIRAIHEWCLDQGLTPYLQVAVNSHCRVPREHVRDGQIVLNVGTAATNQLMLGNEEIQFQARFNGAVFSVLVPVGAVAAIYARENGQGMVFETEPADTETLDPVSLPDSPRPQLGTAPQPSAKPTVDLSGPKPAGDRSHLTRIK